MTCNINIELLLKHISDVPILILIIHYILSFIYITICYSRFNKSIVGVLCMFGWFKLCAH